MGIQFLEVPKWGLSMEEGTVVEWLIDLGVEFSEGDEICEIETSKITNVVEAPFSGTLRRILAERGVTLPVGAPIAVVADASVSDAEIDAAMGGVPPGDVRAVTAVEASDGAVAAAVPVAQETASHAAVSAEIPEALRGETAAGVFATPAALAVARANEIDLGRVTGTGRGGRISVEDIADAVAATGGSVSADTSQVAQVRATPLARRVADQLGVDLSEVTPSGPKGRILRADVDRASAVSEVPEPASYTNIPMNGMRKAIAENLTASARDIPHFRLTADIKLDALLALRKTLNDAAPQKISVTDMLVKAVSKALVAVPDCNVQVHGDTIRKFNHTDICLAVALDGGLMTPKIAKVDTLSLSAVAAEAARLVAAARQGTLMPDEISGGTFTISNLGMFGVDQFDAIINPPQGAILAVGAGRTEGHGYMNGDNPATIMTVTLSSDHRAIDGALGAQWLQAFRAGVENPMQILL